MPFEEKSAWTMAVLAVVTYTAYLVIVLGRSGPTPLAEVSYIPVLLWTIGVSIAVSIVLHIAYVIVTPGETGQKDVRDREIGRFGDYVGQGFVAAGGVATLLMCMIELDHFWIANVVYLTFTLSAVVGSAAKIVAYRKGFQSW